jgi:hypothetical protein
VSAAEATITVIFRRHPFDTGIAVTVPVDAYRARLAPIDFPSVDADALDRMLCTPGADRKLRDRRELVAALSHEVAKALADMLGAKDTEMGYPKEQRR